MAGRVELSIEVARDIAHVRLIDGSRGVVLAMGATPFDRFLVTPVVAATRFVDASDAQLARASDVLSNVLGPQVTAAMAAATLEARIADRLVIDLIAEPKLASLPWELVAHDGDPIGADPRVVWRRVAALPYQQPGEAGTPIVALLAAGPSGEGTAAYDPVVPDLADAWAPSAGRLSRTAVVPGVASVDEIVATIEETAFGGPTDVLVLVAHGRPGELLLADASGEASWVAAAELAHRLAGRVRLVLLASCRSAELGTGTPAAAAAFVAAGIPVIAMHREVYVRAASTLSTALVRALRQGRSLEEAVRRARIELNALDVHARSYAMASLWQGREAVVLRPTSPAATGVPPAPPDPRFERFEGRVEVLAEIAAFAVDPARRVLAVIGNPGSGKSRILRRLHDEPTVPRVLASALRDPDPGTESASTPGTVTTRLGEALAFEAGGVDGLEDWRRQSREAATLTDEDRWRDLVASQPGPDGPSLVLVDALDESPDPERLRAFLGHVLSTLPDGIHVVLSARDPSDLPRLASGPPLTVIDLRDHTEPEAVASYAEWVLAGPGGVEDPATRARLARSIGGRASGIFLYARAVCAEVLSGTLVAHDDPGLVASGGFRLPAGMGDLYASLPERVGAARWPDARSVVAAICGGQDPSGFSTVDLADLLDQPETVIRDLVRDPVLAPFLRTTDGRLRPFHASLTDWMEGHDDGVVATDVHRQLATSLLELADVTQDQPLDRYALRHLAHHLIEVARSPSVRAASWARTELAHLTDLGFLAQAVRAGLVADLARDLDIAIELGAPIERERLTLVRLLAHEPAPEADRIDQVLQVLQWAATAAADRQLAHAADAELDRLGSRRSRADWISDPYGDELLARIPVTSWHWRPFEWNCTGTHLAGAVDRFGIRCLEVGTQRLHTVPGHHPNARWSPDGTQLAVIHTPMASDQAPPAWWMQRSVSVFDVTDASIRTWPLGPFESIDRWVDGSRLLLRGYDDQVVVATMADGSVSIEPLAVLDSEAQGGDRHTWDPERQELLWLDQRHLHVRSVSGGPTRSHIVPLPPEQRTRPHQLTWAGHPGRHILLAHDRLALVSVEDHTLVVLFERVLDDDECPPFDPDGDLTVGPFQRAGGITTITGRRALVAVDGPQGTSSSPPVPDFDPDHDPIVALSPDGSRLACAQQDGVTLIDLTSHEVQRAFPCPDSRPRSLRWNPGGSAVAALAPSEVSLIDWGDPERDKTAKGALMFDLAWAPDGRHLCIAGAEEVKVLAADRLPPTARSRDAADRRHVNRLVTGTWASDGEAFAYVTNVSIGVMGLDGEILTEHEHGQWIGWADGTRLRWVAGGAADPALLLRTTATLTEVHPARGTEGTLFHAPPGSVWAPDPSGTVVASVDREALRVVALTTGEIRGTVAITPRSSRGRRIRSAVAWASHGRLLAATQRHKIHIVAVDESGGIAVVDQMPGTLASVAWDPSGTRLVYGDGDGVFLWTADSQPVPVLERPADARRFRTAWSASGRFLALSGYKAGRSRGGPSDGLVIVDTHSGLVVPSRVPDGFVRAVDAHPVADEFFVVKDAEQWIVRPRAAQAERLPAVSQCEWARWSPDGARVVLGGTRTSMISLPDPSSLG